MGLPAPARNRCGASGQSGEASLVRFLNHFSQLVSQRALREEPVLRRSKEEGRGGGGQSHTPRSNLPGGSRHGSTAQSGSMQRRSVHLPEEESQTVQSPLHHGPGGLIQGQLGALRGPSGASPSRAPGQLLVMGNTEPAAGRPQW